VGGALEGCHHEDLVGPVEVSGRLVEDQDLRVREQGPGQEQPLALPS
jgi:hypothetical protein